MGGNLTASGWGRTVATDNRISARLWAIDVQLKSSKKCAEYLLKVNSKIVVDPNTILCSTYHQKKGPHRGDSGGKTFQIAKKPYNKLTELGLWRLDLFAVLVG